MPANIHNRLKKENPKVFTMRIALSLTTLILSAYPSIIDQYILLIFITSINFLVSLSYGVEIRHYITIMIFTILRIAAEVLYMMGLFIIITNVLLLKEAQTITYIIGYTLLAVYVTNLLFMVLRDYRDMKKVV